MSREIAPKLIDLDINILQHWQREDQRKCEKRHSLKNENENTEIQASSYKAFVTM